MKAEKVIYADILVAVNTVVDYLLLSASARISGKRMLRVRTVAAAFIGGIYSLVLIMPEPGMMPSLLFKAASGTLMGFTAFYKKGTGAREFLKDVGIFLGVSFLFAGIMFGIWSVFRPERMLWRNGAVYFDADAATVVISALAAYIVSEALFRIFRKRAVKVKNYRVKLFFCGKETEFEAFVDSGNGLSGGMFSTPVAVMPVKLAGRIFPDELCRILNDAYADGEDVRRIRKKYKVRYIPYSTASGGGVMPAVEAEKTVLYDGEKMTDAGKMLIGISAEDGIGEKVILSPEISETEIKGRSVVG